VRVTGDLARRALEPLAAAAGLGLSACAFGMIRVAEATMARALRRVSVERGLDPSTLTLVAFGGAGPLSGCALAELLGVQRVLFPPHAGALSALGMAAAADMAERAVAVHLPAGRFAAEAEAVAGPLAAQLAVDLPGATVAYVAECRYAGQGYELDVPCTPGAWNRVAADFHDVHQRAFGHRDPAATVEVVELRAVGRAAGGTGQIGWPRRSTIGGTARLRIHLGDRETDAAGYQWDALPLGQQLIGPAVVEGPGATAFLPPGWTGRVNQIGAIVVEASDTRSR
jgi:N-methylhydantoinase A